MNRPIMHPSIEHKPRSEMLHKACGLLFLTALSTQPLFAVDTNVTGEYQFFPCETRVKVKIVNLPEVAGVRLADMTESCGTGLEIGFYPADATFEIEDKWNANRERMPLMSVTENGEFFDIKVLWNAMEMPVIYTATHLASATPDASLTPDKPGGPPLRVSLEPIKDQAHVGINVVASNGERIIADLERLKDLRFDNKALLSDAPFTFIFDNIPVRSLIALIADVSAVSVRPEGKSTFVFGKPANAAKISQLRSELEALPDSTEQERRMELLQSIIDLAATNKPDELPSDVVPELEELTKLHIDRDEYARAKALVLIQIDQIRTFQGAVGSADHAHALLNLGQVLRLENDLEDAAATLSNALVMLERYPDNRTLPARARAIREQAYVTLNSGNLAEASIIIQRANALLEDKRLPECDAAEVFRARSSIEQLTGWIATRHLEKGDRASAQVHIEDALKLTEAMFGKEDELTDNARYLAGLNLSELGNKSLASEFFLEQIAISTSRQQPLSVAYIQSTLLLCSNLAEQEKFSAAVENWNRHVSLLRTSTGDSSNYYVAALKDLALLHRLGMDAPKAVQVENSIASVRVESGGAMASSNLPDGLDTYMDTRLLPMLLRVHYTRTIPASADVQKADYPTMLQAKWRVAEIMASEEQYASAIIALHDIGIAAKENLPERSEEARRYKDRLNEICAIYKPLATPEVFPGYACPG